MNQFEGGKYKSLLLIASVRKKKLVIYSFYIIQIKSQRSSNFSREFTFLLATPEPVVRDHRECKEEKVRQLLFLHHSNKISAFVKFLPRVLGLIQLNISFPREIIMKSNYQSIRNKKRLAIYLLKLSSRGEIVKMNLRKLLRDIYLETGEIFAKSDFGGSL